MHLSMDGNPLSPNESLFPKKRPGRSIFIGHKMSLHLISEDMIEEDADRSSSQKYSKFHKGDCYGALHIEKKDTKRLETTEASEVLILEHEAIAKCIVDKIKKLWDEYQKNERQRRLQIKLRKQAILQNKQNKRRARDKSKRRGSHVGQHGGGHTHHHHHQRRTSKHIHTSRDFAESQMDGRDSRKSFINSLLKGGSTGGRHNTRGPSMRKMSVRRSQHNRRASKRMSISIVSEHEQRERSGSKIIASSTARGDDEASSENRKGSTSSNGSKEETATTGADGTSDNIMVPKQEEPISSKDMSFEDAMAASNRAEAQNLRTIEYISNYSERMLMEEEDNIMQIIHEKDLQANRARRRRMKEQSHKNIMLQKKQEALQRKAKQIQRERKRRDRKEKLRKEREKAEKERREREAAKQRALIRKREQEEREGMAKEESEQTGNGDKFWGIDVAEKRRIERLRKQVQEKLCMWREMGEKMRIEDTVRQRDESVSFRRKYMSSFWKSPVLVQDDEKSHSSVFRTNGTHLQSSSKIVTTPNNEKQRSIFVQKKPLSPSRRRRK